MALDATDRSPPHIVKAVREALARAELSVSPTNCSAIERRAKVGLGRCQDALTALGALGHARRSSRAHYHEPEWHLTREGWQAAGLRPPIWAT